MLETPFRFEPALTPEEFQKLGQLALRWSHIEHITGNCLKVMLRLSDEEAVAIVFPMPLERRLDKLNELATLNPVNREAQTALNELSYVIKLINYVRNNVVHAIAAEDADGEIGFHLRSKMRTLTKSQVFSIEEVTNYAAHAVLSLRYALGLKDEPGARHPLPERPEIPEWLLQVFPIPKKLKTEAR